MMAYMVRFLGLAHLGSGYGLDGGYRCARCLGAIGLSGHYECVDCSSSHSGIGDVLMEVPEGHLWVVDGGYMSIMVKWVGRCNSKRCAKCLGEVAMIIDQLGREKCMDCDEHAGGIYFLEMSVPEGCLWVTV